MTITIKKSGKRYEVVSSTEGILTRHNTKATATKMAKKIRGMKSQMYYY
jgi:hypothetical protein